MVLYFSTLNSDEIWGVYHATWHTMLGQTILGSIAIVGVLIGYSIGDMGKAIKICLLAQVMAFLLSTIPLFIYPNTLQSLAAQPPEFFAVHSGAQLSRIEEFIFGWGILLTIIGTVTSTFGSFLRGRRINR
jgi:hypothetical protein